MVLDSDVGFARTQAAAAPPAASSAAPVQVPSSLAVWDQSLSLAGPQRPGGLAGPAFSGPGEANRCQT